MSRTDSASRLIPSSPEEIFVALINPVALTAWLPPAGMTGTFEQFDARPGGGYRLILSYVDASEGHGKTTPESDIVDARFLEIVPDSRVVEAIDFVSDDPAYSGTMTITWELVPTAGATRVDVRAESVPPGISAEDHAAGLHSSLANLARYLER